LYKNNLYITHFKPLIDFCSALIGFILLFPTFVLICLILFFFNHRKVFFKQKRPGKNKQNFTLYKFVTMDDNEQVTPIGTFLRKYSLDEIPQLLNVIKGEMSLIGPRPLLPEYLALYTDYQSQRHDILPGITGLAQVKGRNQLSWQHRFRYDVFYVKNQSICLDLYILKITIKNLFSRKKIKEAGVLIEKFKGNK